MTVATDPMIDDAQLKKLASLNFEETEADEQGSSPESIKTPHDPEILDELTPLDIPDEEEVSISIGDRPFQKNPLSKMVLGMLIAGGVFIGVGVVYSQSVQNAAGIIEENKATPVKVADKDVATKASNPDPTSKRLGQAESTLASRILKDELGNWKEKAKAKAITDAKVKNDAKRNKGQTAAMDSARDPVERSYPSLPEPSYSPAPFRSSAPDPAPVRSYPSSGRSLDDSPAHLSREVEPKEKPHLLAFGGLPQNEKAQSSQGSPDVNPSSDRQGSQAYTPASYGQSSSPVGFDSKGGALRSQQESFLNSSKLVSFGLSDKAAGAVATEAILPGRFVVALSEPLGSLPSGSTLIFETSQVSAGGKFSAFAIAMVEGRGASQRIKALPQQAIGLYAPSGKMLKAKKPGAGFLGSVGGRMLIGGLQEASSRFLSTDSTTTVSNFGSQTSSRAGGKGMADIGLSFAKGSVNPLMELLQPKEATQDSLTVSINQPVLVKVIAPFSL
jgi:hypothetical protein